MPDFVRRIVSGPKARYVDQKLGIDLDLVYVTDRLIIMGWPASSIQALYRNSRKDVRKFLESRHGHKYRIYNLCPCSENRYEAEEFYGSVSRYPFPDHHPPPLSMIPMFVADMTAWFAEDPCNVAVIHCKAGKGRSGTMACSYLLSLPILPPAPQSMRNCGNKYDRMQLEALRQNKGESKEKASPPKSNLGTPDGATTPNSEIGNETLRPLLHLDIYGAARPFPVADESDKAEVKDDEKKLEELSKRLNAVFEFHTSRRLKPAKSPSISATSSPLRSRKSSFNASQTDDSLGVSPMLARKRSLSHLIQSFNKGNATPPKLPTASSEISKGSPFAVTNYNANLVALGASPAGRSELNLNRGRLSSTTKLTRAASQSLDPSASSLSFVSFATVNDGSSSMIRRGSEPLAVFGSSSQLAISDPSSGRKLAMDNRLGRMATSHSSQSSSGQSDGLHSPQLEQHNTPLSPPMLTFDDEPADKQENVVSPRLAVSIPSQRRWVGYWARMLAGLDPRASLDSYLMQPSRRQVRILRIHVDRRSSSKNGQEGEGNLSVQIAKYNDKLVSRLETWERNARRRNRVFGALDPSAASPSFPSSASKKKRISNAFAAEEKRNVQSQAQKAAMKAIREKENEEGWKDCERQNYNHKQEYDRKLRQHGNDTGVGQWGINVLAEKDTLRGFDWDDESGSQIESVALISESSRISLPDVKSTGLLSDARLAERCRDSEANTCIIRYTYEPGNNQTTHRGATTPLPTWTKPSGAKDTFTKLFRKTTKDDKKPDTATTDSNNSQSYSSSDTLQSRSTNEPISPATSEEFDHTASEAANKGLLLDADREVQFRILLGRSGVTHSKLPDMLSAGYIWMIPSFETPLLKGEKKPKKGQVVKCQFCMGEIDFRKGKKSAPLMGGGDIRSVTIEFEWVEVGWHEEENDDDTNDDDDELSGRAN